MGRRCAPADQPQLPRDRGLDRTLSPRGSFPRPAATVNRSREEGPAPRGALDKTLTRKEHFACAIEQQLTLNLAAVLARLTQSEKNLLAESAHQKRLISEREFATKYGGACPMPKPYYQWREEVSLLVGEHRADVRHDRPGLLSMANAGPGTDGSQFFLTFVETPWLDGKHTIFGEVVDGKETLAAIERCGSRSGAPSEKLVIQEATADVT